VSRAYYAALHWAEEGKDKCPEIHVDTVRGGSHEVVIQRYIQHRTSLPAKQAGYILRDMRNKRESADYDLSGQCLASDATYQIAAAERVQRLVGEI